MYPPHTPSASDKVLLLPELLTSILLHLPPTSLLLHARPVSHFWKQLIDTSPALLWATWKLPHNLHSYPSKPFSDIVEPNNTLIDALKRQPLVINSSRLYGPPNEETKAVGIRWVGHRYWYYKCIPGVIGDPGKEEILARALETSRRKILGREDVAGDGREYTVDCRGEHDDDSVRYISRFQDRPGIRPALEKMYMTRPPLRTMTIKFSFLRDSSGEKTPMRVEDLVINKQGDYITANTFLEEISWWLVSRDAGFRGGSGPTAYTELEFLCCNYLQNMITVSADQKEESGVFEMVFPRSLERGAGKEVPRWDSVLGEGYTPPGGVMGILEVGSVRFSCYPHYGRDAMSYAAEWD